MILGRGLGKLVPCLKVSLMSAENKEEMACSASKSHVPIHQVRAPPPARVVGGWLPFLPAQQIASGPRKWLPARADVHPRGEGPLIRTALVGSRIPMMEL
jgi:hypothetical protein